MPVVHDRAVALYRRYDWLLHELAKQSHQPFFVIAEHIAINCKLQIFKISAFIRRVKPYQYRLSLFFSLSKIFWTLTFLSSLSSEDIREELALFSWDRSVDSLTLRLGSKQWFWQFYSFLLLLALGIYLVELSLFGVDFFLSYLLESVFMFDVTLFSFNIFSRSRSYSNYFSRVSKPCFYNLSLSVSSLISAFYLLIYFRR